MGPFYSWDNGKAISAETETKDKNSRICEIHDNMGISDKVLSGWFRSVFEEKNGLLFTSAKPKPSQCSASEIQRAHLQPGAFFYQMAGNNNAV